MNAGDLIKHKMTGRFGLLVRIEHKLYDDNGVLISKTPTGLILTPEGMHYEELKFFELVNHQST